jgi:hypothetical protein
MDAAEWPRDFCAEAQPQGHLGEVPEGNRPGLRRQVGRLPLRVGGGFILRRLAIGNDVYDQRAFRFYWKYVILSTVYYSSIVVLLNST